MTAFDPLRTLATSKFESTKWGMKRVICTAILVYAALITACGPIGSTHPKKVAFHGVEYAFPRSEIDAAVYPPDRLFVRLAPPNAPYHLILDEWADFPSRLGPEIPRISRLSDVWVGKFTVTRLPSGPVVCDTGPQPHFNCGLLIEDGPVKWAVLFDKNLVGRAEKLRAEATGDIARYKKAAISV